MGGLRSVMSTELVTLPLGPVVPWVLTVIGPDGGAAKTCSGQMPPKITAGPYRAAAPSGSVAVIGVAEPDGGNETEGLSVLAVAGALPWRLICGSQPSLDWGPPKRPTLV